MRIMKNPFKKTLKRVLYKRGYCIHRIGHFDFFLSLLEAFLRKNNELFFIQIGANDGKSFDPIYQFITNNPQNVRGILLEPLEDYFEELKKITRNSLMSPFLI